VAIPGAGSVLRMRPDGSPSPRTTAVAIPGAAPEVFTYGHRNAQGLAIHPGTGAIWVHEHGPRGGDEINILRGGANYGWPVVTYGREYSGGSIGTGTEAPGMEPPLLHWTPSIAPSGMAFYTGDEFPRWRGDLFVGALAGRHLRRVVLRGDEVIGQEVLLDRQVGRIRDVRQGPDGALWVLTDEPSGALYRITNPDR
jgi:glucose/arabinose dehydrogenase